MLKTITINTETHKVVPIEPSGGISVRQYYAAKAMEQLLEHLLPCMFGGLDGTENELAKGAFKIADAMIAFERNE